MNDHIYVKACIGTETDDAKVRTQRCIAEAELANDAIANTPLRQYVSECLVNARLAIRKDSIDRGTAEGPLKE